MIAQLAGVAADSRSDFARLTEAVADSRREAAAERSRAEQQMRSAIQDSHEGLLAVVTALQADASAKAERRSSGVAAAGRF